jgi:hypothetical protein
MTPGKVIAFIVGAGMIAWVAWAIGSALYGYFADEIKESLRHGDTTKSGFISGLNGLYTCTAMSILILLVLVIVIWIGSFAWEMLFGPPSKPDFEGWRY